MGIEKSKKLITSKIEAGTKTKIVRDAIKTDNIAQNGYCSRDIYLQLEKNHRSVITLVIIHRREDFH